MRFLKNKRLIAGVIVVVGIVAAAMWPSSLEVGATRVTRGPMQVTIDEDGVTRIRDKFTVSAPVAGRLERIELEPGDDVTGGKTVLARLTTAESPLLDPRTRGELDAAVDAARAAVGQAQAERARSNAELDRARTTLQRQQELKKAGAIASDALDAAETAMKTAQEAARAAEFTVSRTQYELQVAQARLKAPPAAGRAITIVAPVTGVILKRFHESETVVPVGDPLIEIGDPSRIEIVADLLSTDAVRIAPAAEVIIDQWGKSAAQRQGAPGRTSRVHEGLRARRRGTARQRDRRLRRSCRRGAPTWRRLSGRSSHRDLEGRQCGEGARGRAVQTRRGVGSVRCQHRSREAPNGEAGPAQRHGSA